MLTLFMLDSYIGGYRALRGANISDEAATDLVQAMGGHVEARVNAANQPLTAQLKRTEAVMLGRIDALMAEKATAEKVKEARIKNWQWAASWIVGSIGTGGS